MRSQLVLRPWWQRGLWFIIRVTFLVLLAISGALLLFQHRLIYHPRPYPPNVALRPGIERLAFTTAAGPQVCWWVPGRGQPDGSKRIWVCFAGNASQARMWHDFLDDVPNGLLLIEFPGYGESAGSPSSTAILAATNGAVAALRQRLGSEQPSSLQPGSLPPLGVLGHSLGCAAALQFAAQQAEAGTPIERMVLISPFTNMLDMARQVVGWPLCHLLLHRFDNTRSLRRIFAHSLPQIDIFHGLDDQLIPIAMSRELKAEFPSIRLHEIANADHNEVLNEVISAVRDRL